MAIVKNKNKKDQYFKALYRALLPFSIFIILTIKNKTLHFPSLLQV